MAGQAPYASGTEQALLCSALPSPSGVPAAFVLVSAHSCRFACPCAGLWRVPGGDAAAALQAGVAAAGGVRARGAEALHRHGRPQVRSGIKGPSRLSGKEQCVVDLLAITACSIKPDMLGEERVSGSRAAVRPCVVLASSRLAWAHAAAAAAPCRDPLPQLLTAGKPICAATIRVGLGYLEVRNAKAWTSTLHSMMDPSRDTHMVYCL